MKLFSPTVEEARLLRRPNRFIMEVADRHGRELRIHCPNPGKLLEFLIPGQELLIEKTDDPGRRTEGTAVAVLYKGKVIFLYAAKANDVAGNLILPERFPGRRIQAEYTVGSSRFDFLVHPSGTGGEKQKRLIEVKGCSLCEESVAMFPDAATSRGSRHVTELAQLSRQERGLQSEVLFVISHGDAERFMPNPHTDPDFCLALDRASKEVALGAVSVDTNRAGEVSVANWSVPVHTKDAAALAEANRGVYLLVIELQNPLTVPVPRIGSPSLSPGWYIYAGSAKANLHQRIVRHLRKKKNIHWHIDHLTSAASKIVSLPILSFRDLECPLAGDIASLADGVVPSFGCSDCRCDSHLFYFTTNPLHRRPVLDLLFHYRHTLFC